MALRALSLSVYLLLPLSITRSLSPPLPLPLPFSLSRVQRMVCHSPTIGGVMQEPYLEAILMALRALTQLSRLKEAGHPSKVDGFVHCQLKKIPQGSLVKRT